MFMGKKQKQQKRAEIKLQDKAALLLFLIALAWVFFNFFPQIEKPELIEKKFYEDNERVGVDFKSFNVLVKINSNNTAQCNQRIWIEQKNGDSFELDYFNLHQYCSFELIENNTVFEEQKICKNSYEKILLFSAMQERFASGRSFYNIESSLNPAVFFVIDSNGSKRIIGGLNGGSNTNSVEKIEFECDLEKNENNEKEDELFESSYFK